MFIDSHCHLNRLDLTAYQGQLSLALQAARNQQVSHFLCVAVELNDVPELLAIAAQHSDVDISVGLHPTENPMENPSIETLMALAQHPRVIAIGETGLDYYRGEGDMEWQRLRFRQHIQVAKTLRKPLIIHTRQAQEDTLRILQEEKASEVGGVFHCFTESWEMAEQGLAMGFYLSFSGIVSFKNAQTLHEVVKRVPLDRMLIETDAPYLAPVPYRGKPNQPAYVTYVAQAIADLRGVNVRLIAEQTSLNYYRLFKNGDFSFPNNL